MQTYKDKLQELGVEALEENKVEIKKEIANSVIEMAKKCPQYIEKLLGALCETISYGGGDDDE